MTLYSSIAVGLLMGLIFGFLLEKGRVFEPGYIIGQMQLKNFIMLKVFLASVVSGLVIIAFLNGFGFSGIHPKPLLWGADIIGGLLLGVGITIAGACPGTILAQIGAGYKDAWFTLVGGILGAGVYIYLEPVLSQTIFYQSVGKITLADLTGVPFWILAIVFAFVFSGVIYFLEKKTAWQKEIGENADGLS